MSTLADHRFLDLERVLEQNIGDVFSYLTYMHAKSDAERAQDKFLSSLKYK